jgi:hypothetical protein
VAAPHRKLRSDVRDTGTETIALPAATQERLEELGRRIDVLAAGTQGKTEETRRGIERRVAVLRKRQAAARIAVYDAAASVEESMLQLANRVDIAEHSVAADMAEDVGTFVAAAREELHGWDVYLERLQVKAASAPGNSREPAEDAIRELRLHRNAVDARLAEANSTSGEGWREVREHVRAARGELESQAGEVEAGPGEGGGCVHGPRRHA